MTYSRIALGIFVVLLFAGCSFQAPHDHVREYSQADPGFDIASNEVKIVRSEVADVAKWQARDVVNIHACLVRTFGWRQMEPRIHFFAELSDSPEGQGKREAFSTLPSGCFDFPAHFDFAYAEPHPHYLKKYLRITGTNDELEGLTRTKVIYIDPWSGSVFSDWAGAEAPTAEDVGPLQMRVNALTFKKVDSRRIVVQNSLGLELHYPFVLTFNDKYARLNAPNAATTESTWANARFQIDGAVLMPDATGSSGRGKSKPRRPLSGFKATAFSDVNGIVSALVEIVIPFDQLGFMDSRPVLALSIRPLANNGQPAPAPLNLSFTFDPRVEQNAYQPEFTSQQNFVEFGPDFVSQPIPNSPGSSVLVRAPKISPAEADEKSTECENGGFRRLEMNQLPAGLTAQDVAAAFDAKGMPTEFLQKFEYLFSKAQIKFPGIPTSSMNSEFLKAPQDFVTWAKVTRAVRVEPTPTDVTEDSQVLAVAANLAYQTTEGGIDGGGIRRNLGVESNEIRSYLGFNALGMGRVWNWAYSDRQDQYVMHETSKTHARIEQSAASRIQNFFADRLTVGIHGRFQNCIYLSFKNAEQSRLAICDSRVETVSQSYYYVTDQSRMDNFSLVDNRNLSERRLLQIFRGADYFNSLRDALADPSRSFEWIRTPHFVASQDLPGIASVQQSVAASNFVEELRSQVHRLYSKKPRPDIDEGLLVAYLSRLIQNPAVYLASQKQIEDLDHLFSNLASTCAQERPTLNQILFAMYRAAETANAHSISAQILTLAKKENL